MDAGAISRGIYLESAACPMYPPSKDMPARRFAPEGAVPDVGFLK
jgi:hypothetical protein